jgi:hypothetical protein
MPATNLFMSYVNAIWTPLPSGTAITLDEITDVDWDLSGDPEEWYADGSIFPKLALTPKNKRNVKLTGGNIRKVLQIPLNTPGTFTVTLRDAVNGVGTGALLFTLTPCVNTGMPHKGATGKFSDGSIMLMGYAPGGTLDPLSFTVAV